MSQSHQDGEYYSQDQYDPSQYPAEGSHPQPPYYATTATARGPTSSQAYAYAPTYQYGAVPYASSSTTRSYGVGQSQPASNLYNFTDPLTSPTLPSPPNGYLPSPPNGFVPSPPNGFVSSPPNGYLPSPPNGYYPTATSPGGTTTTHTLAENEALLKRLRNTAASARFRAKKKQRERTLEEKEKDKKEELERLEERIRELEAENRFLKGMVWAPAGGGGGDRHADGDDGRDTEGGGEKEVEGRKKKGSKGKEKGKEKAR